MALPKSMRYLAGATICVFVFLFVQIFKSPGSDTPIEFPSSKTPTTKENGDWDHDPQLDRMATMTVFNAVSAFLTASCSIGRATRASPTS
jgi:hypothetical protein